MFSGSVEKDDGCGAVSVKSFEGGVAVTDFRDFDRTRTADAFYIVVKNSAYFGSPGLSEHEQSEFHFSPYFLRFSRSVLRLMPRASAERLIW